MGQPIDDLRAPSLGILTAENVLADGPVQQDQLPVDRQRSSDLRTPNPDFELLEELGITGGRLEGGIHANQAITPFTPDK
jgi:hypothetical protein